MKRLGLFFGFFLLSFVFVSFARAEKAVCTLALTVSGPITAGSFDYLQRAQVRAERENCKSILLRINTPGGSLQTTRLIVEQMLASEIPYLCLISPTGAHAGSAGAIILQACHVSGGLQATHLGAATPVLGTGEVMGEDMRNKIVNDTVSWVRGLAELRHRDGNFAEEIVTKAKAVGSREAAQMKALDFSVETEKEFLEKAQGTKVTGVDKKTISVEVGELQEYLPEMRSRLLGFVADPEFAYLLFMGSLGLLYVEITHPGLIAPGVIGGIGLVISLVAFHKLDASWAGFALLVLGLAFLIAEIFFTSYGVLALGGLVSLFMGSIFLFEPGSGYQLSLKLIAITVLILSLVVLPLIYLAWKTLRLRKNDADTDMMKRAGIVRSISADGLSGQLEVLGEFWNFVSKDPLTVGDSVQILARDGLTLTVKRRI